MALNRGFSLVELMVVIAIMSVVAVGATVTFRSVNQGLNDEIVAQGQKGQGTQLEQLLRLDVAQHGQGLVGDFEPCAITYASSAWGSDCNASAPADVAGLLVCHRQGSEYRQIAYVLQDNQLCRHVWQQTASCDGSVSELSTAADICQSPLVNGVESVAFARGAQGHTLDFTLRFKRGLGLTDASDRGGIQRTWTLTPGNVH
ncbi:MAG: type II secretion system protein [Litorivicinus sp.]